MEGVGRLVGIRGNASDVQPEVPQPVDHAANLLEGNLPAPRRVHLQGEVDADAGEGLGVVPPLHAVEAGFGTHTAPT